MRERILLFSHLSNPIPNSFYFEREMFYERNFFVWHYFVP